ncbi:hypothetical protein AWB67_07211 [Caballeronia terrestris]|uniref:Uncharacterized protein n=1 Tax=Caballeronia terrestris TaxID=1226301 RepID=A0A158KZB7_9BURK|nr:hypothetical protein AWB67_07211 [Caballeronia terrestris]
MHARHDVLVAIRGQNGRRHGFGLNILDGAVKQADEVARVCRRLSPQDSIDCAHQPNEIVHGLIARLWRKFRVFPYPFHFIENCVLRFLLPMEQKHLLEQGRKLAVRLDAGPIVSLREEFDEAGQRKHRPGRLAEYDRSNVIGPWFERITRRHPRTNHGLDAAKQLLVLQFFVGEANQCLKCNLVTEPVVAAHVEDLGSNETLDQTEDICVRTTLNLRQQAPLGDAQKRQPIDERQAVRQEFFREIEFAMTKHVAINVPPDALGHFHASSIARGINVRLRDGCFNVGNGTPHPERSELGTGQRRRIDCGHDWLLRDEGWLRYEKRGDITSEGQ